MSVRVPAKPRRRSDAEIVGRRGGLSATLALSALGPAQGLSAAPALKDYIFLVNAVNDLLK